MSRGVPTAADAEQNYAGRFEELLRALSNPKLDALLSALQEGSVGASPAPSLADISEGDLEMEVNLTGSFGFKREEARELILILRDTRLAIHGRAATTVELRQRLVVLYNASVQELRRSREESRKEKKRRKRKVGQGITSGVFGVGLIAADTQYPPLAPVSFGLGGAAIHQALRDLVGEAPESE